MPSFWRPPPQQETARLLLERAHDEFVSGNEGDPRLRDVRPLVRDSWQRSLSQLVGAEAAPRLEMTADAFEAHRRAHPLAGAVGVIRSLLLPGGGEEEGVIVAIGDAAGRLLWIEGDRRLRARTAEMGFVEGADWSEGSVGTAAPGTALALDRAVQIRGAEHFNRFVQPWSCTAAPVHDPESGALMGVIDVTGGPEAVTPQAHLLVNATVRAIEGELMLTRLRARAAAPPPARPTARSRRAPETGRATLRVLGRDRALLDVAAADGAGRLVTTELSMRHAELLLMLATHREGLSAERLGELVYGEPEASVTLRAEMVRLRKVLQRHAPALAPTSRPYRLGTELETDAGQLLSLLDRGAHRVALAAYRGDVLPESTAPGVEEYRDHVASALRETLLGAASVDVLLSFAETAHGADDVEVLRLCLGMLPARSPKRAGLVARIERLEAPEQPEG